MIFQGHRKVEDMEKTSLVSSTSKLASTESVKSFSPISILPLITKSETLKEVNPTSGNNDSASSTIVTRVREGSEQQHPIVVGLVGDGTDESSSPVLPIGVIPMDISTMASQVTLSTSVTADGTESAVKGSKVYSFFSKVLFIHSG